MRILFLLTITLILVSSALIAGQLEKNVTLKTDTGNISGTLLIPDTKNKTIVALIISGSGPTDRDGNNSVMKNNSLKMLAVGLFNNGIATLRYDKRGVGKSKKAGLKETDLRFENYVEDAKGWIQFLKHKGFKQIIVIGHSEGSLIGMIVSQLKDVAKFISLAGVGQSADKILLEQLKAQPAIVLEQARPIIDKLAQGKTVKNIPPMLRALFRPSVQPYIISWFKYNPQIEIAKLKKPVLIIQGTTDIQVSVAEADKLAMANQGAKKEIIKGMNHILKAAVLDRKKNIKTYYQPKLPLKPELIKVITKFIQ